MITEWIPCCLLFVQLALEFWKPVLTSLVKIWLPLAIKRNLSNVIWCINFHPRSKTAPQLCGDKLWICDLWTKWTPGLGEDSDKRQREAEVAEKEERGRSPATGLGNLAVSFTSVSELHEGACCFLPFMWNLVWGTQLQGICEMIKGGTGQAFPCVGWIITQGGWTGTPTTLYAITWYGPKTHFLLCSSRSWEEEEEQCGAASPVVVSKQCRAERALLLQGVLAYMFLWCRWRMFRH